MQSFQQGSTLKQGASIMELELRERRKPRSEALDGQTSVNNSGAKQRAAV